MRKPTFFERLTGALPANEYDDLFEDEQLDTEAPDDAFGVQELVDSPTEEDTTQEEINTEISTSQESELKLDVYETDDAIIVRSMIPGINPDTIDISLTRDILTIKGTREEHQEVTKDEYYYQELYWGSFSRTVQLPAEVELDEAEANEQYGMLVLRLPKIDKERQTTLKVKSK